MKKRTLLILVLYTLFVVTMLFFTACKSDGEKQNEAPDKEETYMNLIYAAKDDLGRTVKYPQNENDVSYRENKEVGLFYFLWTGASSAEGPYDVSKTIANDPDAALSEEAWIAAGGGAKSMRHWWGESIFGYFRAADPYVLDRDVQMLTDAGVDFLVIDYSNGNSYPTQLEVLLKALDKYYQQGFDVPKVSFVTKANSARHINEIYEEAYQAYPQYDHLWYRYDGKPMIIGAVDSPDISAQAREYFTILYAQWPRETPRDDGFPWMDFQRPQHLYGVNMSKTMMSVSVAQHCGTLAFSSSAFYGDTTNRTRSYHNGANDTAPDAYLYGYNFAEQFEYAISVDPDIIFVTGWNEWIATRQMTWHGLEKTEVVTLVDCCDINNSRDLQPMTGGYGDNYYMQLCDYIRQYKGYKQINTAIEPQADQKQATVDVKGAFEQWDEVSAYYLDYTEDTTHRDFRGFGRIVYKNETGRNDLHIMKVANDENNIYFYAQTVSDIVGWGEDHCMSLFLGTGTQTADWYGYDYVVSRVAGNEEGLVLEKRTQSGWEKCAVLEYKAEGNKLQFCIPADVLGLSGEKYSLQFKWVDNYQGEDDFWSFYKDGDTAPYGRFNYVYTKK